MTAWIDVFSSLSRETRPFLVDPVAGAHLCGVMADVLEGQLRHQADPLAFLIGLEKQFRDLDGQNAETQQIARAGLEVVREVRKRYLRRPVGAPN